MAQIMFEAVRWKNFLSTGNVFSEIPLNKYKNALIVGKNGAGKSTILDALCFGLFGKAFRNINKPSLINSINGKDCVVEIDFSIQTKKYRVVRGMKPNVFQVFCDGILVNQDAAAKDYQNFLESVILKFNYKAFTQIVILGSSSYVPFMKLSAYDRRAIVDDLLDVVIFTSMNTVVKEKLSQIKLDSIQNEADIKSINDQLKLQKKFIEDAKKNADAERTQKIEEMNDNISAVDSYEKQIALIQKHIEQMLASIRDKVSVSNSISSLRKMEIKIENNKNKISKDIQFFVNNDDCPTCTQQISQEFKEGILLTKRTKHKEVEDGLVALQLEMQKYDARQAQIDDILDKISEHNSEIARHGATINQLKKNIAKQKLEIDGLQGKKPFDESLEKLARELYAKYQELVVERERISNDRAYSEAAAILLKDNGIKAKIVKQYLPVINKLVNKYLASLDFFVNFEMDEEFKETIKSRHRDEFTYENFSEGERMRIDLSLLFTFRAIARMKNSINTNLLIMDEIFDGAIDSSGTDELMKLIDQLSEDSNIFVISHKTDALIDKFNTVIKFDKVKNFSRMEIN